MIGTPGIAGKLFSTLGDNKINVYAIAQGSSERNISCVVKKEETEKAIKVIHKSFLGV
ncbi:MAG: ACT domain-containing protein [Spirochaetaceae bacterium]|nr:ACT domain-containing protein [Spirochaetaceae bacterium]